MVILDLETDGLLDTVTKIHCASAYNLVTKEWNIFVPDDWSTLMFDFETRGLSELIPFLDTCDELSCHNGIGFDLKVLKKLYNYEYKGHYRDTLLISRILWPDMESPSYTKDNGKTARVKGPHSIQSWGIRLGIAKPSHEDWSEFSEEMLHRNIEDVKIQAALYEHINNHVKHLSEKDHRLDLESVFKMEHRVWNFIEEQSEYGWLFDLEKAYSLVDELEAEMKRIDTEILPHLPLRVIRPYDSHCTAFKQDGTLTVHASNWFLQFPDADINNVGGDFSRIKFERMNLNSPDQLKDYLFANGWVPTKFNFKKDKHNKFIRDYKNGGKLIKTSPKLPKEIEEWEEVEKLCDNPSIRLITLRYKVKHRLGLLKGQNKNGRKTGLIENLRPDFRVSAGANTCGCNTTRMQHTVVVNIPKAKESIYYGPQLRSLFIAPEGKVLVGIDASALEARCEAHYIYPFDKEGAMELIEGDIHSKNASIFGTDRDIAKNGKYCLVYGGSAPKLATTLGKPKSMAEELYEAYWSGNPGLKKLKQLVETAYQKWGYLLSIDKRPLTIRYKHALINTLFQSCGSVAMKLALCIFEDELKKKQLYAPAVGNFHDEMQRECDPKIAEEVGRLGVWSIEEAARLLNFNVPLTGEFKIGKHWGETH